MTRTQARQLAREKLAVAMERRGRSWGNLAESVRGGFENVWLAPALDALEEAMLSSGHEEADEDGAEADRA